MFHGNAGNIGHRVPIAKMLQQSLSCNVFMLEYRGYGLSTGMPDEAGIMIDAQTGLDYIKNRADLRDSTFVVYGQSLGGAVSIQLVADERNRGKVGGLILENTFTSMRKLIPRYVTWSLFEVLTDNPKCHATGEISCPILPSSVGQRYLPSSYQGRASTIPEWLTR
jgi:pimeloyl-ACP methyl ester carboxylesterase